ncbi:MAG: CaiB/BaiF CoA transferase family protein [Alphaproteobacteria bacterium]
MTEQLHRRNFQPDAKGPLAGLRVLDLSRLVAGNMLSLQLADFGAEVVKIEAPGKGDPLRAWRDENVSSNWKVYARNKKSVTLNLREAEARDILLRLVEGSAALVENYRPGRLEEMGLGPDVLHARNPDLILVRVTGFGQTGPYRNLPGFGTLVEGMSGFAARNGFADREPVLPPLALADMIAGLYGAMATMIALREVELKGGHGQVIDLSLLEPMVSVLGAQALAYRASGQMPERVGSGSNTSSPRNVYRTKDGKYVAISASIQSMAERLFRAIGREDMVADPRYATNSERVKRRPEVDAIVGGFIAQRTMAENLAFFREAQVTAGPIYDIADMLTDPHFREREVMVDLPDDGLGAVPMHAVTPRLSDTPGAFRLPAPELGQHNAEILGSLGYDADAIADLTRRRVI